MSNLTGRAKIETISADMKLKYGVLDSALSTLEKNRVEQLEKFYPNLICTQSLGHVAVTSELLHKQSVGIKQICMLFPQRRGSQFKHAYGAHVLLVSGAH
ncbi:hypothetical protein RIF29_14159 [Crotalaria pallida]|uniref:Uncharacterized protein n=1 Tax=Crotalaria pallida TaxID=3830 RepID=A0AAN9IA20_CROPI